MYKKKCSTLSQLFSPGITHIRTRSERTETVVHGIFNIRARTMNNPKINLFKKNQMRGSFQAYGYIVSVSK